MSKRTKQTVKQKIKQIIEDRDRALEANDRKTKQLAEQNILLERVQREADLLIEKYNKLAGKFNSIRTLVTTD